MTVENFVSGTIPIQEPSVAAPSPPVKDPVPAKETLMGRHGALVERIDFLESMLVSRLVRLENLMKELHVDA